MNKFIVIAAICLVTGCDEDKTASVHLYRLLNKDSANVIRVGKLFIQSDSFYIYVYNEKAGTHRLFSFDQPGKNIVPFFTYDAGIGTSEARFVDGNFDGKTDLEIELESGGNYDSEVKLLFIKTGASFVQTPVQLSYPEYDAGNKLILSRYQGPNDSLITIERYHWVGDSLLLKNKVYMPELKD